MNKKENTIIIEEYACKTIDMLKKESLAYLKKGCFKDSSGAFPYKIRELKDDKLEIENSSYSGIIQLDDVRIHFSTKVQANLFYMLSFLKDEKAFCYDPDVVIDIKQGENFFDIIGRMFLNELEEIFKKGFYKKYVRKEEDVKFLKGKFLVNKQIKNDIKKRVNFFCSYEDLTYDNLENQIILKAITLLIPLIRFNEYVKRNLIRYSYLLKEKVNFVNVGVDDCNKVQLSRLNDYYASILQFSKIIFQNCFIRSTQSGESKGFNFIVNMNKVYEDFITAMLEELIEEDKDFDDYTIEKQKKFNSLVVETDLITKPDVILKRNGSVNDYPLIIDAKYKKGDTQADYYQVIAYSLAIPTAISGCLIYPDTKKADKKYTLVKDPTNADSPKVMLHSVSIDLDKDLDFNDYVKAIKKDLKGIVLQCL